MKSNEIDIHKELKKYFGFNQFKGLQEQVIRSLITGKNSFVIMPTGGGKSLCYQLPALMLDGLTLVVSPLIALMKEKGMDDVLLTGGGIIPESDIHTLQELGVGKLFAPGTPTTTIASYISEWVATHRNF